MLDRGLYQLKDSYDLFKTSLTRTVTSTKYLQRFYKDVVDLLFIQLNIEVTNNKCPLTCIWEKSFFLRPYLILINLIFFRTSPVGTSLVG